MFAFLGRLSAAHPRKVCIGCLVAGFLLLLLTPFWDVHRGDGDARFLPDRCDGVRGQRLLQQTFPGCADGSQLVLGLERDQPLGAEDVALANQIRNDLAAQGLGRPGPAIDAVDDRLVLVRVALDSPPRSAATRLTLDRIESAARERVYAVASGPRLVLAGTAVLGRDRDRAALWTNVATITALAGVLTLVLLLIYRAPLLALTGSVSAATSTALALKVISLTTWIDGTSLLGGSQSVLGVLLFGLVAVATLVFVRRLREEMTEGRFLSQALARTVTQVGPRLLISAAVFGGGWLLLGFAEYGRLRATGLGMVLALPVLVTTFLLLLPAILGLLGRRAFWEAWQFPRHLPAVLPPLVAIWRERLIRIVTTQPAWVGAGLLVLLTPLALVGLRVKVADRPDADVSPWSSNSRGLACLERHQVAGEAGPLSVLLLSHSDWTTPQGREFLAHATNSLERIPQVAVVRSFTGSGFRGDADAAPVSPAFLAGLKANNPWLPQRPTSVTRLEVVFRSSAGSPESISGVEVVQAWLRERMPSATAGLGSVSWEVAGEPVTTRDLARVAGSDGNRTAWIILAVLLTVLVVLLGRLETVVHLVLAVLVSYPVALGFAGIVQGWWGGAAGGELDVPTAVLLFPILVVGGAALSLIKSPRSSDDPQRSEADEKLQRGLTWRARRTAGYGLLWAGLWAVLVLAGRGTVARLGIAAASGLLVDALVVRRFLVPALAVYLWRQYRELLGAWQRVSQPEPVRRAS